MQNPEIETYYISDNPGSKDDSILFVAFCANSVLENSLLGKRIIMIILQIALPEIRKIIIAWL